MQYNGFGPLIVLPYTTATVLVQVTEARLQSVTVNESVATERAQLPSRLLIEPLEPVANTTVPGAVESAISPWPPLRIWSWVALPVKLTPEAPSTPSTYMA